jgi:predicted nucleic acid-binding Zn finger protein
MSSGSVQPDIEPRTIRAATEIMTVIEEADALFLVVTESGSEYRVDLCEPACTCPDFEYRDDIQECKHIRRVRIEVGQVDIDALAESLADRATSVEQEAEELEETVEEMEDTAKELDNAAQRLEEVAR